ncbi:MAG: branched-chain amino acid ABC transporter permease [Lachnospiraceae bacterium]|nr:branched-chain amino acid ABC transporter permease [Lachnospiraceae bacterium]
MGKEKTNKGKFLGQLSPSTKNLCETVLGLLVIYIVIMAMGSMGKLSNSFSNLLSGLCIYAIIAVGLNLCVGFLGELSLGHAGFMSVGAFVSASITHAMADSVESLYARFFIALVAGTLAAAIAGFLIGIPVLRLNGDYLAIVTLAFGEIIKGILNVFYLGKDVNGLHFSFVQDNSRELGEGKKMIINGAKGIMGTPHATTFSIGMVLLILSLVLVTFLVDSRTGRAIQAIRDNRIAAESVGINITRYKIIAFSISAGIAGIAGVLYSHYLSTTTASKFDFNMSILVLVFVVLGGLGNFRGSIVAAIILTLLPEMLRGLSNYRMLIYSILLIVMMIFNWAPAAVEWRARHLPKFLQKREE